MILLQGFTTFRFGLLRNGLWIYKAFYFLNCGERMLLQLQTATTNLVFSMRLFFI